MKYFVLGIFLLIVAFDIFVWWNSKIRNRKEKRNKKDLENRITPVFEVKKNYIPINGSYDIIISDFYEYGALLQIHCSITQNDELIRGFCSRDLTSFEQKIRSEIRMIFDRLEDKKTDRTIKMWYCNSDGSAFSDTNDIPLKIIITFFKPSNMDDKTKELLKQCIYPHLQDLVEIDWNEVNTILKHCCYTKEHSIVKFLNIISNSDAGENGISDSTKNICRHLSMDMNFFYENQWFYGGSNSMSVYENLKAKYTEIKDCYLESLAHEYARDTVF
ncbi:MAG: hypothetical protein K2K46_04115 [Lachnospiraceae bacterium]|nr:hypothetical protein [Lachnospiraceae bacterium]